eukprot:g76901.t1
MRFTFKALAGADGFLVAFHDFGTLGTSNNPEINSKSFLDLVRGCYAQSMIEAGEAADVGNACGTAASEAADVGNACGTAASEAADVGNACGTAAMCSA